MAAPLLKELFYNIDSDRVSRVIIILRSIRKMTQEQLSGIAGRGKNFIYFLEAKKRPLTVEGLKLIADGLGINSAVLLYFFLEINKRNWFKRQTHKIFNIKEEIEKTLDVEERALLKLMDSPQSAG